MSVTLYYGEGRTNINVDLYKCKVKVATKLWQLFIVRCRAYLASEGHQQVLEFINNTAKITPNTKKLICKTEIPFFCRNF